MDTDPSESDIEGSDSEDESDTEEDTAQTVRATAEELAERTDIGMVRFTVRSVRSLSLQDSTLCLLSLLVGKQAESNS